MLMNIVKNGVKFTDNGKVGISLKFVNNENKNKSKNPNFAQYSCTCGTLETTVLDTGHGIEEEKQKKLFKIFEVLG